MEVYPDGVFCFVCGFVGPTNPEDQVYERKEPENIKETLDYVESLPIRDIRGLQLRSDEEGFYIIWPGRNFYKKRLYEGKVRYVGPRGHRPPPMVLPGDQNVVTVVEGELNALSLKQVFSGTVISAGAASELPRLAELCLRFPYTNVIVDKDIPGVAFGLQLKEKLLKLKKRVNFVATEKDLNQILQDEGKEGLKEWSKQHLAMSARMLTE
jgi:hypothetical protein